MFPSIHILFMSILLQIQRHSTFFLFRLNIVQLFGCGKITSFPGTRDIRLRERKYCIFHPSRHLCSLLDLICLLWMLMCGFQQVAFLIALFCSSFWGLRHGVRRCMARTKLEGCSRLGSYSGGRVLSWLTGSVK